MELPEPNGGAETARLRGRDDGALGRDTTVTVTLACGDTEVGSCRLEWCGHPDLSIVDALARLQLALGRWGCSIRLHDVRGGELSALLNLVGLRREMSGQAEGGEEALGLEEGVEPGDPVAGDLEDL
jgi:hypothetical protein